MRIGIIGGGAAGLTTAYLLNDQHAVTLFEASDRLGGHAHTVNVDHEGECIALDAGFEFFSERMYPCFNRLLSLLHVPLTHYPLTATFYRTDRRDVTLLPPLHDGRPVAAGFTPRALANLIQMAIVLRFAIRVMKPPDTTTSLKAFVETLPVLPYFKKQFLYPFLLAGWCVEPDEFQQFVAYNALRYAYMHQPAGLSPVQWSEITGGMQTYIQLLAGQLNGVEIKLSSPVDSLSLDDETWVVCAANGSIQRFDQVVVATNAQQAARLVSGLPAMESVRTLLDRVEFFPTTIALHGDTRLMPPRVEHWSVVNIRYDGRHSQNTVWKRWKSRRPIFKSWITYEENLPNPLYATATYVHPKVNAHYFRAQAGLAEMQGKNRLWLAGTYTNDIDCHESAIVSALRIAEALAPGSARLKQLAGHA